MQAARAHEQPVHVHRRVPVVAAVERRMQRARWARVAVTGQHVIGLVRVRLLDIGERDPGEAGRGGSVEGRHGKRRGDGETTHPERRVPRMLLRLSTMHCAMDVFVTGGTGYVGQAPDPRAAAPWSPGLRAGASSVAGARSTGRGCGRRRCAGRRELRERHPARRNACASRRNAASESVEGCGVRACRPGLDSRERRRGVACERRASRLRQRRASPRR